MAATDYYNPRTTPDPDRFNRPISPLSYAPADVNKPLPSPQHQNTFPPMQGGEGGYSDDLSYAPNHYLRHSIDTGSRPHSYDNSHGDSSPDKYGNDPFSDDIPLRETGRPNPTQQPPLFAPEDGGAHYQPQEKYKRKTSWRARPWFIYFMTVVHVATFCGELVHNSKLQGSPIGTKPNFNYLIGPSTDALINMGARFVPCMRYVEGFKNDNPSQVYPCPNRTTYNIECSLADWCGFGGRDIPSDLPGGKGPAGSMPNQWYRFIIPIFYHVGLVHLAFNMFMQVTLGADMEREIGSFRFILVYFGSGIFGFMLGGNLGPQGQPSVGASGSLFGIFALVFLDICYSWNERRSPKKDMAWLMMDVIIAFVLGLLPFIDNFAHIGGFLAGLALGLALMRSPSQLRRKIGVTATDPPYTPATPTNPYNTSSGSNELIGFRGFIRQPIGFFKGRKRLWWAWWLVRTGMLTLILVVFIVLINNFYLKKMKVCSWCKYLDCLPVNGWCDNLDGLNVRNVTIDANGAVTTSPARLF